VICYSITNPTFNIDNFKPELDHHWTLINLQNQISGGRSKRLLELALRQATAGKPNIEPATC